MIAVSLLPGLTPDAPSGLLVVAWADGRILRARDGKDPRNGYEEGRLSELGLQALRRALLDSNYPKWPAMPLAMDVTRQQTSICVARKGVLHASAQFDPATAGGSALPPEYKLMVRLMKLSLDYPKRANEPMNWMSWFTP